MKTSNYIARLPQEATIKSIEHLPDYDLITIHLPITKERQCPHCGSNNCVIKDSGTWQTVRHLVYGQQGSAITGSPSFSGVSTQFPCVPHSFISFFRNSSPFSGDVF